MPPSTGPAAFDPIRLEIIKGALASTRAECAALLENTAMSDFIREKGDFFVGILDETGRLVVSDNQPVFGTILAPIAAHFPPEDMQPGDLYIYNDCYGSGGSVSHSPDFVFCSPVFAERHIIAYVFSWAHFLDIGGGEVGSTTPNARDVLAEGMVIPPVRFIRDGRMDDQLFRILLKNTRFPDIVRGDIRAMIASVHLAEKRVRELAGRFGIEVLRQGFHGLIAQTEEVVRARLGRMFAPGSYRFADAIDGDGRGGGPFAIRLEMTVSDNGIVLDGRGSDDQAAGPVNFIMSDAVLKLALGIYATADDPSILLNHGAINAINDVLLRPGSILKPLWPAPIGQRMMTLLRGVSCCAGLLAQADPQHAIASGSSYVLFYVRGRKPVSNALFTVIDGLGVGHGARSFADGHDAVYLHHVKNYPVEYLEHAYPVRLRAYGINADSGGPGRWRGGCGVYREFEMLTDNCLIGVRMDNVVNPPWGVNGGMSGRSGRFILNPGTPRERVVRGLVDAITVNRGDVVRIETVGGGGFGHPFDREADRVLDDVQNRIVTAEGARADYGVVVADNLSAVDEDETRRLRRQARWDAKLFHRGTYYDAPEWFEAHGAKRAVAS